MIESIIDAVNHIWSEGKRSAFGYEIRLKAGYAFDKSRSKIIDSASSNGESIKGNTAAVIGNYIAFVPTGYLGGSGVMIPLSSVNSIMRL